MYHVITLKGYSPHKNLRQFRCWLLSDLFDLSNFVMVKWWWMTTPCECNNSWICLHHVVPLQGEIFSTSIFRPKLMLTFVCLFLNFQFSPKSNTIMRQELLAPCCIFNGTFYTKISKEFELYLSLPFWNFILAQSQAALWKQ